MKNPYEKNTAEYAQWERGYLEEPFSAPPNNAPPAEWHGYHSAYNDAFVKRLSQSKEGVTS
jgi:hypothetical protein